MKDVFLSHATQDKELFVRPFSRILEEENVSFWLDEAEIKWGDKISAQINKGLNTSRFIVVFITPAFIGRNWTETELSAALSRENDEGRTVVLPIITGEPNSLLRNYPMLRDKRYRQWTDGPKAIAGDLKRLVQESERRSNERLKSLVHDRWSGKRRVAETLTDIIKQPASDISDFARLELGLHEFARLGPSASHQSISELRDASIDNSVVRRGLGTLVSMCLIAQGNLLQADNVFGDAMREEVKIEQQRHYVALQEGLVYVALGRHGDAGKAWRTMSGGQPRFDEQIYPFGAATWDYARALLAVVASDRPVEKIISSISPQKYRGIAHLTAKTGRFMRRSKIILDQIEEWSNEEGWAARHSRRTLSGRLHSFEKDVLSVSGSLFGVLKF